MNKTALFLLLGATLGAALTGCGKSAANEKNFAATVTQYFDNKGRLCLDPVRWPVDVYETDQRQRKLYPDGEAGQMAALEAAGLARGEDVELPGTFVDGRPGGVKVRVRRYTMADAARPYLHAEAGRKPRLCWGRKSLDKVLRWADPQKLDGVEQTSILYTYKLSDVAPWARRPEVKQAFPVLGRNVDGEHKQKEKLYVKLTPEGWEAFGLKD